MQLIATLNHHSAVLIENKLYGPAIKLLRKAILLKLDDCTLLTPGGTCTGTFNTLMTNGDSTTKVKTAVDQQTCTTKTESVGRCFHFITDAECIDDEDFVYRTPLRSNLEATADAEKNENESEDELLEYILLFNIALAYHLWALEEGRDHPNVRRLKKALQYYELSFSIQADIGHLSITQILALVNNCASIYRQLDRKQRADKFYRHMLSALMTMVELGETSDVDQLNGFLHNVCRLILKDVAAPAA